MISNIKYPRLANLLFALLASLPVFATSGVIIAVHDGDTIDVSIHNVITTIRVYGIDAPELAQPFGDESKNFWVDLLGRQVEVNYFEVDRYGRMIAEIYLDDQNLGLALIEQGLAWHYWVYSDDEDYIEAELNARQNESGLWRQETPVPPWNYRESLAVQPVFEGAERVQAPEKPLVITNASLKPYSDRPSENRTDQAYSSDSYAGTRSARSRNTTGNRPKLDMTRDVHVRGHWRETKNGRTWVRSHTRSRPSK